MGPLLLGNFGITMLLRVPIGFALAAASLITLWLVSDVPLTIGAQRIVAGITPFSLLAIPLFILAGGIMNAGGITRRLLDLADSMVGGMRGGLAQTNVLSSLFFGGISGSAVADVSSLGRILIPAMKERNYKAAFSAAVTAAAPVVAPIMPPSITMIVYGVVSGTSIGKLFFAGIVPAVLYIAMLMVTVHLVVRKQGFTDEAMIATTNINNIGKMKRAERPQFWVSLYRAIPALILPVVILAGIRFGLFTPTEAAAVAVVYALAVGWLVYRELDFKKLVHSMADSALVVGLIMLVLAAAQLYSWALTSGKVPQAAAEAVFGITENPIILLALLNVLLLIAGMFIEANAALIILTPILLPVALSIGVDPVHLGVIIVVNLGIGLVTPPVGIALMLSAEIAKVPMVQAVKAVVPFLITGLIFLVLITYVPQISLWLPGLLMP
ncbi:TRAP transporter large permease [Microterricola viridarii]|uniref:TRAP transporter, DctM subunit n=1 Tax=Microterricola viridarii TaxID=412690 RepID=A0A1H1QCN3_9MICO|nr:TRAP transporter large permease [Microterricola viridarii]SDS21195.1 TRAP transporter, DctM subunit [Microterricola viridarii]